MDWKQVGLSTAADKSAWATIGGLGASGGHSLYIYIYIIYIARIVPTFKDYVKYFYVCILVLCKSKGGVT
jgi:hypothetical protein